MIFGEEATAVRLERLAGGARTELQQNIIPFWLALRDVSRGGFFGAANSRGRALPSAPKGAVLHARILWFFSTAFMRFRDKALLDAAVCAYRFIAERLIDPNYGGVFWSADADGAPDDTRKHVYAQAFAIYGLSAFYRASGDAGALRHAQRIWQTVELRAADSTNRGYFEAFSREWQTSTNELMGRADEAKSSNAHLHLLEAYGALWCVWPDPALRARLEQLILLLTGTFLDRAENTFRQFIDSDLQGLDDGFSNGHDIEASWLIPAVAELLPREIVNHASEAVAGIAKAVHNRALHEHGGLATGVGPDCQQSKEWIWWVQAEALVGFLDAFERSGEPRFLAATEQVWGFIDRWFIDRTWGEWRWRVEPGEPAPPASPKAHLWKCPYHNGRACLEILERTDRLLS